MALLILRCVFLAVAIALGMSLANSKQLEEFEGWVTWAAFLGVLLVAVGVLVADSSIRRKKLDAITAVYFGLFIGLVLTYVFRIALTPFLTGASQDVINWMQLGIGAIVCYSCISVLLQTKDDFRFIIPYVEFAKEVKGLKPTCSTRAS
jgi:hypothetical protein